MIANLVESFNYYKFKKKNSSFFIHSRNRRTSWPLCWGQSLDCAWVLWRHARHYWYPFRVPINISKYLSQPWKSSYLLTSPRFIHSTRLFYNLICCPSSAAGGVIPSSTTLSAADDWHFRPAILCNCAIPKHSLCQTLYHIRKYSGTKETRVKIALKKNQKSVWSILIKLSTKLRIWLYVRMKSVFCKYLICFSQVFSMSDN